MAFLSSGSVTANKHIHAQTFSNTASKTSEYLDFVKRNFSKKKKQVTDIRHTLSLVSHSSLNKKHKNTA